uniref:Glypican-3 n=1 Tax=Hucho hucho TaxID=62062 RepID=A0A4W5PT21_9TELE
MFSGLFLLMCLLEMSFKAAQFSNILSTFLSLSSLSPPPLPLYLPEAFELVLRHGRNSTLLVLKAEFPGLGGGAQGAVGQLFLDVSLYILGSDSSVEHMVQAFFTRLFPLTYRHLLGGGAAPISEECLRGSWKDSIAFGPYPKLMMTRLSRSLLATRVFLQALNLGIEVVNTTDHLRPGRDCGRALLRLWYCPHCQGLLGAPACKGFCQTLMSGCLGGAVEVQPHWRGYVEGLGKLAGAMRGEQDMEAVMMRLHVLLWLPLPLSLTLSLHPSLQVRSTCGHAPQRVSRSVAPFPDQTPAAQAFRIPQPFPYDPEETLAGRRREFISSLRGFSSFFSGLGEALCSREPAAPMLLCLTSWENQNKSAKNSGKKIVDLHKSGSSSGAISKRLKVPRSSVQAIVCKYKHHGTTQPSYGSGRRRVLLSRLQPKLVPLLARVVFCGRSHRSSSYRRSTFHFLCFFVFVIHTWFLSHNYMFLI